MNGLLKTRRNSGQTCVLIATLVCLGLFCPVPFHPLEARVIELGPDKTHTNPLPGANYLKDADAELRIDDLIGPDAPPFQTASRKILNYGYGSAAYWVRFKVNNTTPDRNWLLEVNYPQIDRVEFYVGDANGRLVRMRAGDLYPFRERGIAHRNFVFRLPRSVGERMVYIRFSSAGTISINLRLVVQEQYYRDVGTEQYIFGVYYGILLVMVFLYSFVAFSIKESSAVFYVWHILFYGLFQLAINGLASQFMWPDTPRVANLMPPLAATLALIAGVWFTRAFLDTAQYSPTLDRFLIGCIYFAWGALFAFYFVGYAVMIRVVTTMAVVFALAMLLAGFTTLKRRYRPARFFLAGWTMFLAGICMYALFVSGLVPESLAQAARYAGQVGSAVQMLILGLAIIDRITILRREKENAQARALEEERKQAKLKQMVNIKLEMEVEKKTAELRTAMGELEKNERMVQRELKMARDIQTGMLPGKDIERKGVRVAAHIRYMTGVGGDYFDIFRISRDRIGFLIADASGHGIPAALITVMAKTSFMDVTRLYSSPRKVMQIVNRILARSDTSLSYLTAFFFTLDSRYRVSYSGAGHVDPLIYRRETGSIETWNATGSILGLLNDDEVIYHESDARLEEGDRVLLYTDGIVESRDPSGSDFGSARLWKLFRDSASMPLNEARDFIIKSFHEFIGTEPVEDDVTFMLIEIDKNCKPDREHFGDE